ncbi:MAG: DUF1292 domain-containing protein [Clostridia bacterium]|nr:DUF1292 domain-containing protein [Clostridia bacterium]
MTDKKKKYEEPGDPGSPDFPDDIVDFDDFDGPTVITIYDEEGNPLECELLGFVDYQDERYAIVSPTDDEEGIAAVLKLKNDPEDDESAILETVDDEDLANTVFEKFKEEYAQDADFDDEED